MGDKVEKYINEGAEDSVIQGESIVKVHGFVWSKNAAVGGQGGGKMFGDAASEEADLKGQSGKMMQELKLQT